MPWFATVYAANGAPLPKGLALARCGDYGGHLWARNRRHARALVIRRHLNERILFVAGSRWPHPRPSTLARRRKRFDLKALIHATAYLCHVALKSGAVPIDDVLGDEGVLHQLAHRLQHGPDPLWDMRQIALKLLVIERSTPGFCPDGAYS